MPWPSRRAVQPMCAQLSDTENIVKSPGCPPPCAHFCETYFVFPLDFCFVHWFFFMIFRLIVRTLTNGLAIEICEYKNFSQTAQPRSIPSTGVISALQKCLFGRVCKVKGFVLGPFDDWWMRLYRLDIYCGYKSETLNKQYTLFCTYLNQFPDKCQ